MSFDVDPRTLASLAALSRQLGIRDIGISPERREIYLLGGARSLTSLLGHSIFLAWHRGRHDVERTWGRLEVVILDLLREAEVPQPGPIGSNGPWYEGVLPNDDFASSWDVIPIPSPGGPQHTWWSARSGRRMRPVEVAPRRFCDDPPAEGFGTPPSGNRPALLELTMGRLPPIFVSHGVGLHDMRAIEECGGLLWPSFAVTWKVPPSYGDVVFLADIRLLVDSLSPTGRSFRRDLFLSPTDSWSPTARELADVEAAATYELRGDADWWHGKYGVPGYGGRPGSRGDRYIKDRLIASASRASDLVGSFAPDSASSRVTSMSRLWGRIKRLVSIHSRVSGLYGYEPPDDIDRRLGHGSTADADRYAYLELKVRGMAPIADMVACFYPRQRSRRVNAFLDRMSFSGWRVPFDHVGPVADESGHDDAERSRWAENATRAILEWSKDPCGTASVVPSDVLESPSSRTYSPVAPYSLRNDLGLDASYAHRFRWSPGRCSLDAPP